MAITSYAEAETWDFINLHKGNKWPPYSFEVVDENDAAVSLAGATVTMQIRLMPISTPIVREYNETDGFTISGNTVTFNDDAIIDFGPGEFVHDIEILLNGETEPHTQYKGIIIVKQNVTKPAA